MILITLIICIAVIGLIWLIDAIKNAPLIEMDEHGICDFMKPKYKSSCAQKQVSHPKK